MAKIIKYLGYVYWLLRGTMMRVYAILDTRAGRNSADPAEAHPDIKIYQIYYDKRSEAHLDPQFTPFHNTHTTKYFAEQAIMNVYDSGAMKDCDYFGVVSWRVKQKIIHWGDLRARIYADNKAHDFYYIKHSIAGFKNQVWRQGSFAHRIDLTSYTEKLIAELGYKDVDLMNMQLVPSYYGYQICRTELYRDFMENFLKPIITKMEDKSRADLQDWLNQDANYTSYGGAVDAERLRKVTGFPYYTKHAFITERLFPTYAALKGWTGKEISNYPTKSKKAAP